MATYGSNMPVCFWSTVYLNTPLGEAPFSRDVSHHHYLLFSHPIGTVGQGKPSPLTADDTNVEQGGFLPTALELGAVQWSIFAENPIDVVLLQECGALAFVFAHTRIPIAPLNLLQVAPEKDTLPPRKSALELLCLEPHDRHVRGQRLLSPSVFIPADTMFGVSLLLGTLHLSGSARVRVSLLGKTVSVIPIG